MRGVIKGHGERATYWIDGRQVSREEYDRAMEEARAALPQVSPPPAGRSGLCGWKPILSDALAVHPLDREKAMEEARAKGVPTEILPDGRVVLSSRSHRKAYLKAFGFFDRQGGYGD